MAFDSLMSLRHKLSTKIVGALLAFLTLALLAISVTLYLSWQLEGSAAAINDTGSLRMNSYRLANIVLRAGEGDAAARAAALRQSDTIARTLAALGQGDPKRPLLLPPTQVIREDFDQLTTTWHYQLRPAALGLFSLQGPAREQALAQFQSDTDRFVAQADALVRQIERDSETRTFWLRASQLALLALTLAKTVSMIHLVLNLIIAPVTRLHEGMRRMKEKEFSVRLAEEGSDEFGALAQGFNQMGNQLQAMYDSLAGAVALKTAALENQNRELALLYDASAFLQLPQPLEPLCQGLLARICDYFHADGGAVRLLDASRSNLHVVVLQGLPSGRTEREPAPAPASCLCGEGVMSMVRVVHELNQMDSAGPGCPEQRFSTVSVFHIYAQQVHLGFFSLHFRQARQFGEREISLLETLGKLFGTAVENMRLGAREREMAVSEERSLLAQGLHDSIAQGLNFLNLQVQMLDQSVRDGKLADVAEMVPLLRAGVQESYEDVRELLVNFRTRLVDGSLIGALEMSVDKFRRQTGMDAELVAEADGPPIPRDQQLQLLFIVQEALSNVRKHANAGKVVVRLQDRDDFTLSISDDGDGFDPARLETDDDGHVGIHIMHERALRIEASLAIVSAPGGGTSVTLTLPHAQRRAA